MTETHEIDGAAPKAQDIIDRINEACIGHPYARIPWPHRLLHEARAEIERLRAEVIRLDEDLSFARRERR